MFNRKFNTNKIQTKDEKSNIIFLDNKLYPIYDSIDNSYGSKELPIPEIEIKNSQENNFRVKKRHTLDMKDAKENQNLIQSKSSDKLNMTSRIEYYN